MTAAEAKKCENLIAEGLGKLDSKGVMLAIQTMPPFLGILGDKGTVIFLLILILLWGFARYIT